jgi:hypothetical protein
MTMKEIDSTEKVPSTVHVINILGIIILWIIIYLCSIDRIVRDSIIIGSAAISSGYLYYRLRNNEKFNIIIFGLTLALFIYIILAQNIIHLRRFYDLNLLRNLQVSRAS